MANIEKAGVPRVYCEQVALADSEGIRTFYVSSGKPASASPQDNWDYGNKSSSILPPSDAVAALHPWLKFERSITVPSATLDSVLRAYSEKQVGLLHMDVQGAELLVLKGGVDTLSKTLCIWLEVSDLVQYIGQPSSSDIDLFLGRHGFRKILDCRNASSGDSLYLNARLFAGKY